MLAHRKTTDITFHVYIVTQNPLRPRWLSSRASDSGARGRGFETYLGRVVSLSKTSKVLIIPLSNSSKVLIISRKRWLRPDMTEKLLTGTFSLNTNKHNPLHNIFQEFITLQLSWYIGFMSLFGDQDQNCVLIQRFNKMIMHWPP